MSWFSCGCHLSLKRLLIVTKRFDARADVIFCEVCTYEVSYCTPSEVAESLMVSNLKIYRYY